MSFVDASAIVAMLNEEPGFEELEKRRGEAVGPLYVSPLVRFEAVAALTRLRIIFTKGKADRDGVIGEVRELVDGFIRALGASEIASIPTRASAPSMPCPDTGKSRATRPP